ncbi:Hypothetical predicted protein [Olea europaea subsp. europaea]|uniref:Uncharacterized protein n=1 Tax=Olea europaea subsp. europaea TaxID=158383 RepID=A0A8S0S906_OLEEU|nr:Hypothetical predicted protein [Olea europaea subsp. europaea]
MAEKSNEEIRPEIEAEAAAVEQPKESGSGGWSGWGFSPLSYLSDLQKAATVAAEEISRNAVEVAKTAAKGITDIQMQAEESESSKEDETEVSANEEESEDENDKRRVYTNGVEEILKKESVEDVSSDQEKTYFGLASSSIIPEMAIGVNDHGEDLVGSKVKVWQPKDKRCREGVVASYDPSKKKHLVG